MAPSKKSDKFSSSRDMRSSSGSRSKEETASGGAPRKYKKTDRFSSSKNKRNPSGVRPKEEGASGGAPRKYKKTKSEHKEKEQLDPIPGNKEWGGLARTGVLRVRHDDQKAEEERLHAPIEEII
ncbi:MAG: hypothetical protein QF844_11815, partial [Acidimicrobiales bacterium]|nr:hypothetical protein [Acidimicrobiales bacterium]